MAPATPTPRRPLALLLALVAGGCAEELEPVPEPFSLLLVTLDTTRADHLSCYGYGRPTTPSLDALAADGVRFEAAYTPMATTLPSHAAMLTALYPRQLGVLANGDLVPAGAETLAEHLAARGFATGAFVSAEPLHPRYGLDQGFDVYTHPDRPQRPGEVARRQAEEWLAGVGDRRFFAFVHLFDPHTWYTPPPAEAVRFGAPPERATGARLPPDRIFVDDPAAFDPATVAASIAAHDAEIAIADAQLGALLETLARLGLRDRTVVAVVADHGETLDELLEEHGYAFDHGEFLLPGELHVPLVLWTPPGVAARRGAVVEELVSTLDLAPTLLELLGQEPPRPASGRSLVPLLLGGSRPEEPVFVERRRRTEKDTHPVLDGDEVAVVARGWQWVGSDTRGEFLYRLGDPEARDVRAEHPEVAAELGALHRAWRERHPEPLYGSTQREATEAELEALRALGYTEAE